MGHNRLPRLPTSRNWQQVVQLLEASAPPQDIVAQAAVAAQRSFQSAADDPVYVEAIRILIALAQAGQTDDSGPSLRRQGVNLNQSETLFDLLDAVSKRLEDVSRTYNGASDLGELSSRALLTTLHTRLLDRMPGLFAEQSGDLANALRHFSGPIGFSELSRSFFTAMTSETLAYWLERTLSAQVDDIGTRDAFDGALHQFSAEATRIIKEFSSGWYAKHALNVESAPVEAVRGFAAVAFKKINDELSRKTGVND